jgi:peptidoglycan/xylan/chitin deacetylase (PgdA/CDA1 family)
METRQAEGHEIGNHTVSHEHPAALTKEGEEVQVEDARNFLDSNFHANILTFAYPYMEMSPGLLFWVKKYNFAARGWPQDQNLLYVKSDVDPDREMGFFPRRMERWVGTGHQERLLLRISDCPESRPRGNKRRG